LARIKGIVVFVAR